MARGDKRSPEELDQEWSELIEEHRLAMPGTQVLFAFLLVLPFQQRFEELSENQVYVYFSALLCAAIGIILLITPTANHRLRWRRGDKEALLVAANRAGDRSHGLSRRGDVRLGLPDHGLPVRRAGHGSSDRNARGTLHLALVRAPAHPPDARARLTRPGQSITKATVTLLTFPVAMPIR